MAADRRQDKPDGEAHTGKTEMARIYVSSVINGRSDRVWARVRDFNGMPSWHPGIAESRIENSEPFAISATIHPECVLLRPTWWGLCSQLFHHGLLPSMRGGFKVGPRTGPG